MYLSYFNLKQNPFQISTDPQFLWLGEKHEEALATLRYGVEDNKGFLLLTGDVGTGKTTLINALLKMLDDSTMVATIRDPGLEVMDFYNYTAHVFAIKGNFTSKSSFLIQFERFLTEANEAGKQVLLIIDEAQRISQELLEEVRLLSNIEKENGKLLNIFFVGQVEFNEILLRPANRAIRQRITVNYNIAPLSAKETSQYIQHRLRIAGGSPEIFAEEAVSEIFSFSKGYPRLINIICDRALLTGFVEDARTITPAHVRECIKELKIASPHPLGNEMKEIDGSAGLDSNPRHEGHKAKRKEYARVTEHKNNYQLLSILFIAVCLLLIFLGFFAVSNNELIFGSGRPLKDFILATLQPVITQTEIKEPERAPDLNTMTITQAEIIEPAENPETSPAEIDEPANHPETNPAEINKPGPSQPAQLATFENPNETGQLFQPAPGEEKQELVNTVTAPDDSEWADPNLEANTMTADERIRESTNNLSNIPGKSDMIQVEQEKDIKTSTALNRTPDSSHQNSKELEIAIKNLVTVDKLVIPFPSNSSLPAIGNLKQIDNLVNDLKDDTGYTLQITGYSDSTGFASYNAKLSEFRANAVKSYLIGKGLPAKKILSRGMGSQDPIASNDTEAGRKANRRVEIEVLR